MDAAVQDCDWICKEVIFRTPSNGRPHPVLRSELVPGTFVVQSAGAQLNRLVKAGTGSSVPKGYHIHADGSLHKNEDEGK